MLDQDDKVTMASEESGVHSVAAAVTATADPNSLQVILH